MLEKKSIFVPYAKKNIQTVSALSLMEKSYIVINVVLKHLIVFATLAYVRLVEKSLVPATQILMHAKTVELILVNVGESNGKEENNGENDEKDENGEDNSEEVHKIKR